MFVSALSSAHLTGGVSMAVVAEYWTVEYVVATPPGNVAFLLALPVLTEDLKYKR